MPNIPCLGNPAGCSSLNRTMTPAQAQALMDRFRQTDMPFDYPRDCCYSRATAMCDIIERDGYACNKFWYQGDLHPVHEDGSPVTFPNPAHPIVWVYHVAPMVQVQQPDGSIQNMILDPSLSDRPLTVDEWKRRCGLRPPSPSDERVTSSRAGYPFGNGGYSEYSVGEANSRMEEHRANRELSRLFNQPF